MKVGYGAICNGYILQPEDTLCIYGFNYEVYDSEGNYYLHCLNGDNDAVFKKLGLSNAEKMEWAIDFGSIGCGMFPEFANLQNLTKFVKAIYEKSPYNVGDSVRIIAREGDGGDYPFSYVDEMNFMAGQIFQIKRIEIVDYDDDTDKEKYHGDPHKYFLTEPDNWAWHSSMFTKEASVQSTIEQPCSKKSDKGKISITLKHTTKTIIKL